MSPINKTKDAILGVLAHESQSVASFSLLHGLVTKAYFLGLQKVKASAKQVEASANMLFVSH